ncbi:hypothetical protein RJ492_001210 [Pluralibacter gergoviae]|uniref:Phage protein Gp138 N-terminal domain-containing protein n=1 Tax=Pluralibacter gergoviae TaxID=61647 RepID=A0AAI9DLD1_PLUGE|nr:hypothetical protein [Pluralibacter gergoviae]EKV9907707.1 hypothetical protein [Pluralibacter gergoviae]EKW7276824.1 hypothetical protein [Pluralibacter gergoviae]ELD4293961.1 hypothetical protein [Pluralibacter gergoviae]ELD4304740.1 hypothetical protein [Pluralibacter gergoviae]
MMIGMPGMIKAYDPKTQRAQVECGIQRVIDGNPETISVLINVPVQFSGTAEWSVFHELPPGTEGYIHFSQRSVDIWLDQGGPAEPLDARMFSASDAFFAPGYRSLKTVIPGLPTVGVGMSNASGSVCIHLTDNGITLRAGDQVVTLNGMGIELRTGQQVVNLTPAGLTHNMINIGNTHKHGGVMPGGGLTGFPTV